MAGFLADEANDITRGELVMPPLDGGEHLIAYLNDVGPMCAGEALCYREIEAWCGLTGHTLEAWEATTLRRLSGAYAGEFSEASDPKRPRPYTPAGAVVPRDEVAERIEAAFDRLAAQHERDGR